MNINNNLMCKLYTNIYVHGASSAVNKNSSQSFDHNSLK